MRFFTLLVLTVPPILAWDHAPNAATLQAAIQSNSFTLVAFIHSTDKQTPILEPEWTSLLSSPLSTPASQLSALHKSSLDCAAANCTPFSLTSFPTIRLYHGSPTQFTRYRGPRRVSSILAFLRRMIRISEQGQPIAHLTASNLTEFVKGDEVIFVGYLPPYATVTTDSGHGAGKEEEEGGGGGEERRRFEEAARRYRDRYSFGIFDTEEREQANRRVECYNVLDDVKGEIGTEELERPGGWDRFVQGCAERLIPELTRRNEIGYYQSGKSIVHYFVRNDKERREYVGEMLPLAKKYGDYLQFTTTDVNEYPDAVEMMGLKRGTGGLSVQTPGTGDVYPYTGNLRLTAHVVEMFLSDIIQGKMKPWQKPWSTEHQEL